MDVVTQKWGEVSFFIFSSEMCFDTYIGTDNRDL